MNKKKETPRHLATVSKSRFRNQIIHALCLVGAAPCDPRRCNYQCNVPFKPSAFPLGKHGSVLLGRTWRRFYKKVVKLTRVTGEFNQSESSIKPVFHLANLFAQKANVIGW